MGGEMQSVLGNIPEWIGAVAEVAVAVAIFWEGGKALIGYRSERLLSAIQYVEDTDTRAARSRLRNLLTPKPSGEWWADQELEKTAAYICSRYNLLGALTKPDREVRKFVVKEWRYNIRSTFELIEDYIVFREGGEGKGVLLRYRELYQEAMASLTAANELTPS
jgi:hypothetical protein